MMAFGVLLADYVRAMVQIALIHLSLGPSGLTALAAAALAGAALATVIVLIACVAEISRTTVALPLLRRTAALREKSWRAAFLRQRDPDAAGRARPRAPSAAPAAAVC